MIGEPEWQGNEWCNLTTYLKFASAKSPPQKKLDMVTIILGWFKAMNSSSNPFRHFGNPPNHITPAVAQLLLNPEPASNPDSGWNKTWQLPQSTYHLG